MSSLTLSRTRTGLVAAATAVLLVATTACGASRGDSGGGPSVPAGTNGASSGATSSTTATFGTLQSPCGKGDASGATDQGVTDSAITIGYGDDRGFTGQPGLDQEIGDATKAMIAWCNQQGGINGRQVTGDFYDAAMTQTETAMQSACKRDFMLVGEGWANDESAEQTRVDCNLAAVPAFAVGPDVSNGPMLYTAAPVPVDYQPATTFFQLAQHFPQTKDAFAFLNTTLPVNASIVARSTPAVEAAGFKVINCGVTLNYMGEPNYLPFAQRLKACGAKIFYITNSPGPVVEGIISALAQVGDKALFVMQHNGYDENFAKWNTAGYADNVYVESEFQPMENASVVPAVQQYLDILKASGGKTGLLGMAAASSFLLWATAAKACGSTLTRQCMIDKLSAVHEWTGGGLHAPTDPGGNQLADCDMTLKMTGTSWAQVYPAEQGKFDCDAKYLVKVPASGWNTTLNSDRIATKFLTSGIIKPQS